MIKYKHQHGAVLAIEDPGVKSDLMIELNLRLTKLGFERVEAIEEEEVVSDELDSFTVPELKAKAEELGLKKSGSKAELISRIREANA